MMSVCGVEIHPREHVLDRGDGTAPSRQHELEHTDLPERLSSGDRLLICPAREDSMSDVGYIPFRAEVCF